MPHCSTVDSLHRLTVTTSMAIQSYADSRLALQLPFHRSPACHSLPFFMFCLFTVTKSSMDSLHTRRSSLQRPFNLALIQGWPFQLSSTIHLPLSSVIYPLSQLYCYKT
jgi:hypothetical protein